MASALTISPPVSRASSSARADFPLAVGPAISQMRAAMQIVLTLVAKDLDSLENLLPHALEAMAGAGCTIEETDILGDGAADLVVEHASVASIRSRAEAALAHHPLDWCVQPLAGRRKRLLVADMDSTIINVECLDELADFAGLKAEISAITERAMRGELEFEPALRERVGKLKGLAVG